MSKIFEFERFNMRAEFGYDVHSMSETGGEWVKAQDALDREAALQAQIRALEAQQRALADVLREAAIDCPHSITEHKITLHRDPKKPGNALGQLRARLTAKVEA